MRCITVLVFVFVLGSCITLVADDSKKEDPKACAIIGVTVIDGTGAAPMLDCTVIVSGERIQAIGPKDKTAIPAGTATINGQGKFLIPGLWDMHVHIATPDYLALFLANGVTGVREMHSFYPDVSVALRDSVREGKLLGPDQKIAYALIDGPNPIWPGSLVAKDAEEGRAAVRKLKEKRADFVKVYSKLMPDTYRAIAAEAKLVGLPMLGHVPEAVSAKEAAMLGHHTMEHLYGIAIAMSTEESKLREEITQAVMGNERGALFSKLGRVQGNAIASHDEAKKKALLMLFKEKNVYQTPTLTVLRSLASLDDPKFTADERVKYMPAMVLNMWKSQYGAGNSAPHFRRLNEFNFRIVKEMHAAGVPILAGTDCTNPYAFPGFSIHEELELLVGCGLSPYDALRAATSTATKSLGIEKEVGTIATGKRADLVLLDADPLADIRNSKKINTVVVKGKLLDRAKLDGMLAAVKKTYAPKK